MLAFTLDVGLKRVTWVFYFLVSLWCLLLSRCTVTASTCDTLSKFLEIYGRASGTQVVAKDMICDLQKVMVVQSGP